MQEYLEVGKIVNTHGVKGELKVIPLTDDPEKRYKKLKWVFIDKNSGLEKYTIESVKFSKRLAIVKFEEINDMTAAEGMINLFMKVDRKNAVKLPADSFFIADLIDCEVFDERGEKLGVLKDVLQTGSNDVYVVEGTNRQILIPALKSVVKEVAVENKRMTVELPEGLMDDEV